MYTLILDQNHNAFPPLSFHLQLDLTKGPTPVKEITCIALLGSASQVPLQLATKSPMPSNNPTQFSFKEGLEVFSPKDLVELPRPGAGIANPPGDLVFVSVSKYSLRDKKYVL